MSSNAAIVCNALSVVDLALIVGSFLYLNNRVQRLEKSKEITHSSKNEGIEDRLNILEEEREILLKRLNGYDDLLLQIMNRFKDINPLLESHSYLVSSLTQAIEDRPALVLNQPLNFLRKRKVSSIVSEKKDKEHILSRRSFFDDADSESDTYEKSIVFSDTDETDEKLESDENDELSSYLRDE